MERFIVEDTIFQGVEGRGRALLLDNVTAASIVRSSFVFNTNGSSDGLPGGAFYAVYSNVLIIAPEREEHYMLLIVLSVLLVALTVTIELDMVGLCSHQYPQLSLREVLKFGENSAVLGGVIIAYYEGSFNITGSSFTNNSASILSGVTLVIEIGYFRITECIFSDNSAGRTCGVIYARNSSFTIRSNTFTNNSAIDYGVIDTSNSSFNIISSTFTTTVLLMVVLWSYINMYLISSAVPLLATILMLRMELYMVTFSSIFNIRDSVFSDNRAKQNCGVICARNSSFSIRSNTFC